MELSLKRKNELLTGIVLAQELKPVIEGTRRFITLKSFKRDDSGRVSCWGKTIPSEDDLKHAIYNLRVYSIRSELIEYDIDESQLSEHTSITGINSLNDLYEEVAPYLDDMTGLIPQWDCDNPIE